MFSCFAPSADADPPRDKSSDNDCHAAPNDNKVETWAGDARISGRGGVVQGSAQGRGNGPISAVEAVRAHRGYFGAGVGTVVAGRAVPALLGTRRAGVKPCWARGASAHPLAIIEFSLDT